MELLIVGALIIWAMSALGSAAKKKQQQAARPDLRAAPADQPAPERPMRPMDVDLPGQTTMPIHWEGSYETPAPRIIPTPDSSLARYYSEEGEPGRLRPSEQVETKEWSFETNRARSQNVTIPGLNLELNSETLVQGIIISEILTKKSPLIRRPR